MNLGKIFSRNKNFLSVILGILLVGYLYLEVPIPLVHILGDISLFFVIIFFLIIISFLFDKVHIVIVIFLIIVMYEIIKKYKKGNKQTIKKNQNYYPKTDPSQVISGNLKEKTTLEETVVENMVPVVKHAPPQPTPRYQGITSELHQASSI